MNSKVVIPILIYILFIIIAITLIIGIFYFKWFINEAKTNSYAKIYDNIQSYKDVKEDVTGDKTFSEKVVKADKDSFSKQLEKKRNDLAPTDTKKIALSDEKKNKTASYTYNDNRGLKVYAKGSSLPDITFDSQGEYISEEEHQYRLSLIKNLVIKSVVIDKLTKGNGVSQEFFKVVYKEKMIPAKILERIVESKEFRELIPKNYRSTENKTIELKRGQKVIFNNKSIRELLLLWSLGRLTPIQKAWKVKAEK